jgi:hypothetical protein
VTIITEVFAIGTALLMGATVLSESPPERVTVLSVSPLDKAWDPGRADTEAELEYVVVLRALVEPRGSDDEVRKPPELVSIRVASGTAVGLEAIGNGTDSDLIGTGSSTGCVPRNEELGGGGGAGIPVGPGPVPTDVGSGTPGPVPMGVGSGTGYSDGRCEEAAMLSRSKSRLCP